MQEDISGNGKQNEPFNGGMKNADIAHKKEMV